jgi:hypothetical protein
MLQMLTDQEDVCQGAQAGQERVQRHCKSLGTVNHRQRVEPCCASDEQYASCQNDAPVKLVVERESNKAGADDNECGGSQYTPFGGASACCVACAYCNTQVHNGKGKQGAVG